MSIEIVRNIMELKGAIARRRREPANSAASVGIVPTMGSIHKAHEKLIQAAKTHSDIVVATIFVNPKQFGENEDFNTYPRNENNDVSILDAIGTNIVYIPTIELMYPKNFDLTVSVPKLSSILCGKFRNKHFDGVATVVTKLLIQSNADYAFFGEKDYQQLVIIQNLVSSLDITCKIMSIPTVRDKNGLALSSRNKYLKKDEKIIANNLYKIISETAKNIISGKDINKDIDRAKNDILKCGFTKIDYLEVRSEKELENIKDYNYNRARIFVAAYVNNIRLIDNIIIK